MQSDARALHGLQCDPQLPRLRRTPSTGADAERWLGPRCVSRPSAISLSAAIAARRVESSRPSAADETPAQTMGPQGRVFDHSALTKRASCKGVATAAPTGSVPNHHGRKDRPGDTRCAGCEGGRTFRGLDGPTTPPLPGISVAANGNQRGTLRRLFKGIRKHE